MPGPPPPGPLVPLRGTPPGITATLVQRTSHTADGSRRTVRPRDPAKGFAQADLSAAHPPTALRSGASRYLSRPGDVSFVLVADHRSWTSVEKQFGDRALEAAFDLVRAGAIILRCEIIGDSTLGRPLRWWRTTIAEQAAGERAHTRASATADAENELRTALAALDDLEQHQPTLPTAGLRRALLREKTRPRQAPKTAAVLAALTHDLRDGVIHDNPRAFSLAHTADSKTWDVAGTLLRAAGVDPLLLDLVGLTRNARIGVGGHLDATIDGHTIGLHRLAGPTLVRADQTGLQFSTTAHTLLVIENLQAAETLCNAYRPNTAIVYNAGRPSPAALRHITDLASQVPTIVLAPDADLGGVRIAEAILNALPTAARARTLLCDVGAVAHDRQPPWPHQSISWVGLNAALTGPAEPLARACLNRGYRVEQEASTVAAIDQILLTST